MHSAHCFATKADSAPRMNLNLPYGKVPAAMSLLILTLPTRLQPTNHPTTQRRLAAATSAERF